MAQFDAVVKLLLQSQSAITEAKKLKRQLLKLQDVATQVQVQSFAKEIAAEGNADRKRARQLIRSNALLERREQLLRAIKRAGIDSKAADDKLSFKDKKQTKRGESVDELVAAAKAAKDQLDIQEDVNRALTRILETQREINRGDRAQAKIRRKNARGGEFDQRIEALRKVGIAEKELEKIQEERFKLADLNSTKSTERAKAQIEEVESLIKAQEKLAKNITARPPGQQIASPISQQPARTVLDSNDALRQQSAFREKQQREARAALKKLEREAIAIEKRIEGNSKDAADRLFEFKLSQIEQLGDLQLQQIKDANKAQLDDFDSRLDQAARGKQRQFSRPLGPGNDAGVAFFRREKKRLADLKRQKIKDDRDEARRKRDLDRQAERAAKQRLREIRKEKREREQAAKKRAQQLDNLAQGIGFPLLFGGGLGAVGGGLAGAALGNKLGVGGFGFQALFSSVGTNIDTLIASSFELAKSFEEVEEAADNLIERNLASSKAVRKQIQALQDAGNVASAAALAQKDLNRTLGTDQFRALKETSKASADLEREFNILAATIQVGIANAIKPAIRFFADLLETINVGNRVNELNKLVLREGTKEQQDKFRQTFNNPSFTTASKAEQKRILNEFQEEFEREARINPIEVPIKLKIEQELERLRSEASKLGGLQDAIGTVRGFNQDNTTEERRQEDFQRRKADLIREQERSIEALRISVERRIQDIRLQNIATANRLEDARANKRKQELNNSLIGFTSGISDQGVSRVASAFEDLIRADLDAEEKKAKIKRDAALNVQRIDLQVERFKIDTARRVAELNERSARQVADIKREAVRIEQDAATRNFGLEREIAVLKLDTIRQELRRDQLALNRQGKFDESGELTPIINEVAGLVNNLKNFKPTPVVNDVSDLTGGGAGVSTAAIDALAQRGTNLLQTIAAVETSIVNLVQEGKTQQILQVLTDTFIVPFEQSKREVETLFSLLGTAPTVQELNLGINIANALAAVDKLQEKINSLNLPPELKKFFETILNGLKTDIPGFVVQQDQAQTLKGLATELKQKEGELTGAIGGRNEVERTKNRLVAAGIALDSKYGQVLLAQARNVDKLTEAQKNNIKIAQQVNGIRDQFAAGFADGLFDAISGVKTLGEAFQDLAADILKAIARTLILNAVTQALGSAGPDGSGLLGRLFPGRAEGGPIQAGQPYIVGEKGPEIIVPNTSGTVLPNEAFDDARGALRGNTEADISDTSEAFVAAANAVERTNQTFSNRQVINQEESNFTSFTQAMMTPGRSTVKFETKSVGGMDVVTRDQALQIGAESAKAAEANVFSALRNKPSVRRSIGMK